MYMCATQTTLNRLKQSKNFYIVYSVAMQYMEIIAVFKTSSKVIIISKFLTIGAASFGQTPDNAFHLPVQGVVGHKNVDA